MGWRLRLLPKASLRRLRKYRAAYYAHQYSAAIGAIREKGVLSGVRIEKSEVGTPGEFDHLSDDELLQAIRKRFHALSLTPDPGSDTTRH